VALMVASFLGLRGSGIVMRTRVPLLTVMGSPGGGVGLVRSSMTVYWKDLESEGS
jgi:hypothetical protein